MSKLQPLQFYFMHFMPYPDVAPCRPQGQWVDIPNRRFDPKIGHKLYKENIDEPVLADRLGYDGLVVNEHHSTFYSLMPSCSVIAGALAMLTERAKICVSGTPIALT
jgi:alkanesulfonate monooxygenase SsuD/methylene tetrahydromethanopterin reductase-like flavin-dependent oxidoreductase (luciferase family)